MYRELLPHPGLRPFVDRFWVSAAAADAGPRRILPDGCIDLMVDLTRAGAAVAVGTMTRAVVFEPRAPVRTVAVRFRPGGAVPFLGVPADELTDRVVDCAAIGARWLAPAPFEGLTDLDAAARTLERCLLGRLAVIPAIDPVVAHVVARLLGPAPPSITTLSRETGWTRQYLARVFRARVGVSPKQLARVARMQRAIDDLQSGRGAGAGAGVHLADAAVGFGYFDQAHMARDFRALAGVTPLVARAAAGSIFPIRSLFAAR